MDNLQIVITKRCRICRKALIWDAENKWWVCTRCGYTTYEYPAPDTVIE